MTIQIRLIASTPGLGVAGVGSAQARVPDLDDPSLGSLATNTSAFLAAALRNDARGAAGLRRGWAA